MMRFFGLCLVLSLSVAACSKSSPPAPTTVAGTNTTVTGTVLERLDGPPYSYLRLKTVPMDSVNTGKKVTITHGAALKNFSAPRLGKRFDLVVFGTVERG